MRPIVHIFALAAVLFALAVHAYEIVKLQHAVQNIQRIARQK